MLSTLRASVNNDKPYSHLLGACHMENDAPERLLQEEHSRPRDLEVKKGESRWMKYTQFVAIAKNVTSRALSPLKPQLLRLILHQLFN
jgi:hypothetical protein